MKYRTTFIQLRNNRKYIEIIINHWMFIFRFKPEEIGNPFWLKKDTRKFHGYFYNKHIFNSVILLSEWVCNTRINYTDSIWFYIKPEIMK